MCLRNPSIPTPSIHYAMLPPSFPLLHCFLEGSKSQVLHWWSLYLPRGGRNSKIVLFIANHSHLLNQKHSKLLVTEKSYIIPTCFSAYIFAWARWYPISFLLVFICLCLIYSQCILLAHCVHRWHLHRGNLLIVYYVLIFFTIIIVDLCLIFRMQNF